MDNKSLIVQIGADSDSLQEAIRNANKSLESFRHSCETFGGISQQFNGITSSMLRTLETFKMFNQFQNQMWSRFKVQCSLARLEMSAMPKQCSTLKIAMMGLGGSISLVGQSLKAAFLSNPLVQAVYALCNAFKTCQKEAFDATKEMEEFNNSMSDLASEQDVYAKKLERLKELSQQQYLSNREQAEAIRLVDQLKEKYPSLNIEFDKATGKIKGMTGAYESLLEQMRQERLLKIGEKQQELSMKKLDAEQTRNKAYNDIQKYKKRLEKPTDPRQRYNDKLQLESAQRTYKEADEEVKKITKEKTKLLNEATNLRNPNLPFLSESTEEKAQNKARLKTVSDAQSLSSSVQGMKRAQEEKGLNEYQKKMKAVREQLEKIQETIKSGGMTDELAESQSQLYKDLHLLEEMEEEYEKNEAAAKAAKDAAEAKRKADEEAAKKEQERLQSLQRIRDLTKQLEDASLSSSQKELKALKDINEELKKRLETTQGLTAEEKAAAQKALADNEKRQNEFVQNRLDPAQAQYNLEMDHLQENLAREREEYLQALEKAKYDESNKDVQTAKKEMEQAEDAIRQQTLTGAQKEQEKAQEEYTEKLSNLNNALTDEDRLKATDEMEAARERLKNATERVYSLKNDAAQKKILEAGKKEQKEMAQMESRGTFSAYGLDSMVSSIPQQQLDYTKRIAMFVQSIFQGQQAEGVTV